MPRESFCGRKSFGRYQCPCGHKWMSAHGYPEGQKGCLGCGKLASHPCCLWHNNRQATASAITASIQGCLSCFLRVPAIQFTDIMQIVR